LFSPVEVEGAESGALGGEPRPGLPLEPLRLVWALRRGWRLIAKVFLLSVPLGLLVAFFLAPREFVAQSVLVWEPAEPSPAPARELQTIASAVKLPAHIEQVRERLKLDGPLEELGKRIQVDAISNESNVLTISGVAHSAQDAVQLAQTVTDIFLDTRLRLARTRNEERLKSLQEEVAEALAHLAAARQKYDTFRAGNQLLDFTLDRKAAIEQLALLRAEVNRNRIEAEASLKRADLLRAALQKTPPQLLLTENQVQADRQKMAELSALLTARRASLSQEHPEVLGLQASVEALGKTPEDAYTVTGRQMGTNPERTALQEQLTSASIDGQAAEQKWQSYARLQEALSTRLLHLTSVEGEAALLLTDVQLAEQRLGQLKTEQNVLETGVRQPSAELRVINPPLLPPWPAQSARRKVALAFPLIAGLLAALYVLGQELRGLRLRTPSEFAFWANAPVLASSSWPQLPEELRELSLELTSQAERAPGTTLLLPLDASRGTMAAELLEALRARTPEAFQLGATGDRVQALRRAARESARVLVLVEAGLHTPLALSGLRRLLGRDQGIGLVVLGVGPELALLRDRVGHVPGFWAPPPALAEASSPA
jgi:uncharacterized protein involved in exopolysaccharide biosynthesis